MRGFTRPERVESFMNAKLKEGLSPRTVQLSLVILRRALKRAMKRGLVGRNVAKEVDGPKVERPEVQPPTPDKLAPSSMPLRVNVGDAGRSRGIPA
jgi:site-specific recombinase XerC